VTDGESTRTEMQEVADLRSQNIELRARLAEASNDLSAAAVRFDALHDELRAARRELDDYRHQLRLMRGSRSWRVTRPLRLLKNRSAVSAIR
jgi:predicted  nucleic acid-binding Zn-ribbon protein